MKSNVFATMVRDYFDNSTGHPLHDFWVSDHLKKAGIPDESLQSYIYAIVEHMEAEYTPRGRRLLDVGCGMGEFSVFLALKGYEVVGIDTDVEQLRIARRLSEENGNVASFLIADAAFLPFPDQCFDLAICFEFFEHIRFPGPILDETYRVSKNSSCVFARFPNKLKLVDDHTGLPFLPLLPRQLQALYVKFAQERGRYYQTGVSVYYRFFQDFLRLARSSGFSVQTIPAHLLLPRPTWLIRLVGKRFPSLAPSIQPYFHLALLKQGDSGLNTSKLAMILERSIWPAIILALWAMGKFKGAFTLARKNLGSFPIRYSGAK